MYCMYVIKCWSALAAVGGLGSGGWMNERASTAGRVGGDGEEAVPQSVRSGFDGFNECISSQKAKGQTDCDLGGFGSLLILLAFLCRGQA